MRYDRTNLEDRRRVVASAIGSNRAEGLELADDDAADIARFVEGEISLSEVRARADARYRR